ncbi:MAG: hypothetical protein AAFQ54_05210 [Pseudomonadota bacterium]
MVRLIRSAILVSVAFGAGLTYERAEARQTCAVEADWGPWLTCAAREMLEEVIP